MRRYRVREIGMLITLIWAVCSCGNSNAEISVVHNYLKLLQQKPQSGGGQYKCIEKSAKTGNEPENIKSWEVTSQLEVADDKYPDSRFKKVQVKITEMDKSGFDVTHTWEASVWRSDDLFEYQKKFFSDLDKALIDSDPEPNQNSPTVPDRKDISSETYCVTNIRRRYTIP